MTRLEAERKHLLWIWKRAQDWPVSTLDLIARSRLRTAEGRRRLDVWLNRRRRS